MFHLALVAVATISGVLAGYVVPPVQALLAGAVLLGVGFGCDRLAEGWVRRRPRLASWLYQGMFLAIFAVVALSTGLATWLALKVPGLLPQIPEGELDTVKGVVVGALNALVAAAWLDDAKKGEEGRLWPAARQKTALSAAFADDPKLVIPLGGERSAALQKLFDAVYSPEADDGRITGWSFGDRLARARIIASYDGIAG